MTAPTLESYIAAGRTEVDRWANLRFRPDSTKILQPPEQGSKAQLQHSAGGELEGDWWCVKASGGNGGMDVWVMDEGNWMAVVEQLHETEEYVIQVCSSWRSHLLPENVVLYNMLRFSCFGLTFISGSIFSCVKSMVFLFHMYVTIDYFQTSNGWSLLFLLLCRL